VSQNNPIKILDKTDQEQSRVVHYEKIINFDFEIFGQELHLIVGIANKDARLADIVPLGRAISSKIVDVIVNKLRSDGELIPCCQGCSACCYYLVPLSIPEAFKLREEILTKNMNPSNRLFESCLSAARCILKHPPPKPFVNIVDPLTETPLVLLNESGVITSWYTGLKLACPFLYESSCIIYDRRPLACREYFVKGAAQACKRQQSNSKEVNMPIEMTVILGRLASELEGTTKEAIILPLISVWYDENKERDMRTWPTSMMVKRFFDIIKEQISEK